MDGGIAQTAAIVGALTSGAGAVIGWLATYWFGKHREEEVRRWESSRDHLHRQIEELYAPLFGLIQQRRAVYDAASRRLPMQEDGRFDRSRFQGEDSKIYNYVVEKYLLPIQGADCWSVTDQDPSARGRRSAGQLCEFSTIPVAV
jgi:hypothetical protein